MNSAFLIILSGLFVAVSTQVSSAHYLLDKHPGNEPQKCKFSLPHISWGASNPHPNNNHRVPNMFNIRIIPYYGSVPRFRIPTAGGEATALAIETPPNSKKFVYKIPKRLYDYIQQIPGDKVIQLSNSALQAIPDACVVH